MMRTTTTSTRQSRIEQALSILEELDFTLLKQKLQDTEEGLSWTQE
jgi:hypothetical protein